MRTHVRCREVSGAKQATQRPVIDESRGTRRATDESAEHANQTAADTQLPADAEQPAQGKAAAGACFVG